MSRALSHFFSLIFFFLSCFIWFPVQAASVKEFNNAYSAYLQAVEVEEYKQAEDDAKRAVNQYRALYGSQRKDFALLLYNLARMASINENWKEAEIAARESMQIFQAVEGEDSLHRIRSAYQLANALLKQDSHITAENTLLQIMTIVDKKEKEIEPALAGDIHLALANALAYKKDGKIIEKHAKKARKFFNQTPMRGDIFIAQATYLEGFGNQEEAKNGNAIQKYKEALNLLEGKVEKNNALYLRIYRTMSQLEAMRGKKSAAQDSADKFQNIVDPKSNWRPLPIDLKKPAYPDKAYRKKLEGWVVLKFNLTAEGFVENAEVTQYEGSSLFKKPALRAIKKSRFAPMIKDGKPVPYEGARFVIIFELDE